MSIVRNVVLIGNLDGLHKGHLGLIRKALELSPNPIIYTFTPHPKKALRLMSDRQKTTELAKLGIQQVIFQEFTPGFAALSPSQFIDQVLMKQLQTTDLVVGPNFAFGCNASGTIQTLKQSDKFRIHIVQPVQVDGEWVSSSRIRNAILQGELILAERLLGRPYSLTGRVVRGEGRGAQLGFPTANLEYEQEVLPPLGVYATHSQSLGLGVTNIGKRPTFGDTNLICVETYFLNFSGSLYEQEIEIFLEYKIRDEKKFTFIEELKQQIREDLKQRSCSMT